MIQILVSYKLKILIDAVSKEVAENKFGKVNTKGNSFDDAGTIMQYYRQANIGLKIDDVENRYLIFALVTSIVLDTKIGEIGNKINDVSGIVNQY